MAKSAQIDKVGWWHERLADWMLANPDRTLGEAAREFNCSQAWISIIKNSDSFRIYWELRSTAVSEEVESRTAGTIVGIKEKTAALTELALDQLNARVERNGVVMPVGELLDIAQVGLKSLGYGANKTAAPAAVNVNIGLVDQATLQKARERALSQFNLQTEEKAGADVVSRPPLEVTDFEVIE